ncbi:Six-hairpin glycosidase-like protein [Dendryphion nanum]|uniref:Six-hairpin glycosidase-like protein n=1 Tax=Dendryphion nanum TaxID=256645 RepID=A0A9P9DEV0_9PLEO|nr:Six-hairpin glycosidase-like protein [Dendryphion nanum]
MNNPVAWQLWGPEAIELAKKSNRLIFISIGYAACHWCHVMERESFENNEVAALLNSSFIPIKIDREERPDVDRIYMNYVQATTGSGGWPLNVFITPDLQPIFGGTYWPGPGSTMATGDHIGFIGILKKIRDVWRDQQQRCLDSAKEITDQLRDFAQDGNISRKDGADQDGLELELLDEAYEHFAAKYDKLHPGFPRGAPKFPTPANLAFLLRLGLYPNAVKDLIGTKEVENAKEMVLATLTAMNRGGIHDQIGNGFARYSVTRDWSLPHFEKMLYDQAQLLPLYLDAYLISKNPELLSAVHDIATYLTTPPLNSETGGFFSAEDADSLYRPADKEKREGAFYVWTLKEFQTILGERDADILARYYNVQDEGNVSPEHDAHDELIDQNVLAIASTPEALAKEFGLSVEDVQKTLSDGRAKLLTHRNTERPRPALDDKIVLSWNGLAIGALARASSALSSTDPQKSKSYLESAQKAATFIKKELYNPSSHTLTRIYRGTPGDVPGFADDYAFLISGLIDLYETTFDDSHLQLADNLQQTQIKLFWDSEHLGFFSTPENQSDLIMRLKDGMDNAEPGTNGVSARNLDRLGALLEDESYVQRARDTAAAFEAEIMQHPFLFPGMMDAVVAGKLGTRHVVITGEGERVEKWLSAYREKPQVLGCVSRIGKGFGAWLKGRNKLVGSMREEKEGVMVCEQGACREELGLGLEGLREELPDLEKR